jgi:hypothetical protein
VIERRENLNEGMGTVFPSIHKIHFCATSKPLFSSYSLNFFQIESACSSSSSCHAACLGLSKGLVQAELLLWIQVSLVATTSRLVIGFYFVPMLKTTIAVCEELISLSEQKTSIIACQNIFNHW